MKTIKRNVIKTFHSIPLNEKKIQNKQFNKIHSYIFDYGWDCLGVYIKMEEGLKGVDKETRRKTLRNIAFTTRLHKSQLSIYAHKQFLLGKVTQRQLSILLKEIEYSF